jgi:hypothetical protein
MMAADRIAEGADRPPKAKEEADQLVRNRLALMNQLQASLTASRTALLALDLSGIELGTREQVNLGRRLEADLRPGVESGRSENSSCGNWVDASAVCDPKLAHALGQSQREVLQALRVQSALLTRAQRKLCVLANVLADPNVNYGPLLVRSGALPHAVLFHGGGER